MNLRHLKLWKRHATTASDVGGDVSKSRGGEVVDVRSPSSEDSGYSDVAPPTTCSFMFGRQNALQPAGYREVAGVPSHLSGQRERGRTTSTSAELRKTGDALVRHFRGLRGSSTPRSGADSSRRTLSPPSADVKSPAVAKMSTTASTSTGGATVEGFFALVREGNVDKLRQFLRDTKFDVNARDTVRNSQLGFHYKRKNKWPK